MTIREVNHQATEAVQVYSNENSKYFNAYGSFPVG